MNYYNFLVLQELFPGLVSLVPKKSAVSKTIVICFFLPVKSGPITKECQKTWYLLDEEHNFFYSLKRNMFYYLMFVVKNLQLTDDENREQSTPN